MESSCMHRMYSVDMFDRLYRCIECGNYFKITSEGKVLKKGTLQQINKFKNKKNGVQKIV